MKVFISWSGERSRKVAELLDEWLQCVIQAVEPWISSKDIDRGALWFSEISDQLAETGIGIVCLTKENKLTPWILFESGALAKGISSNRVCTLLIDLKSTDIKNPLAQFNHSQPNKNGIWDLVRTINSTLKEDSLKENILEKVFTTYWPQFDSSFKAIIKETPEVVDEEIRSDSDILIELLSSVRRLDRKVNNFEKDRKIGITSRTDDTYSISLSHARKLSYQLISAGIAPDDVVIMMANSGISPDTTKKILEDMDLL